MKAWLEVASVSKAFNHRPVLNQLWLQVRPGEAIGLVGANGAGKTTLLRIAAGLVRPDAGCVRSSPEHELRYFGGESTLPGSTRASVWAAALGGETAEKRRIGRLSRGTRQIIGLQVMLSGPSPRVLLLDEPWEGLDPAGSRWLTTAILDWRRAGAAILISSHRLRDLDEVCSRFMLLENGRCQPLAGREEERVDRVAAAIGGMRLT